MNEWIILLSLIIIAVLDCAIAMQISRGISALCAANARRSYRKKIMKSRQLVYDCMDSIKEEAC